MRTIRDYIDPGGRLLAGRLNQLCTTLESLSARLRGTIAQAIGESLGGFVRDAALHLLNDLTERLHSPPHMPRRLPPGAPNTWSTPARQSEEWNYWDDDEECEEDYDEPNEIDEAPESSAKPNRVATALATGLQASSWWLRRCATQPVLWTTMAIGIAAGGIAFMGGPLTGALLGVAGSASQYSFFAEVVTAGARLFGFFARP